MKLSEKAAELAEIFCWDKEAAFIRKHGRPPVGFGREIDDVLSLYACPLTAGDQETQRSLAQLRVHVAQLTLG